MAPSGRSTERTSGPGCWAKQVKRTIFWHCSNSLSGGWWRAACPSPGASIHVGRLHPELFGYAWNWEHDDGYCDEVRVDKASLQTDSYRRNPLFRVIEHGELFRGRIETDGPGGSPLLRGLGKKGFTDDASVPLRTVGRHHNAATVATKQASGFSDEQFREIATLLKIFALQVQRHIALRISENTLTTYLGQAAGSQMLQGSIKRGITETTLRYLSGSLAEGQNGSLQRLWFRKS